VPCDAMGSENAAVADLATTISIKATQIVIQLRNAGFSHVETRWIGNLIGCW